MLTVLLCAFALVPQAEDDTWDVDADHGPSQLFEYEATEGTWISLDVSPDGERIVFDCLGHLYEMDVAGGEATPLTAGRSWNMFPRYGPNGEKILFTSDRGGSNDLWVLDRARGDAANVSDMDLPVFQGTWALDGQHVYGTALNLKVRFPGYRFHLEGGRQELVPAGDRAPVDHFVERPGEEALYFEHKDANIPASGPRIKRFDMRTGEMSIYIDRPGGAASPAISPDGRYLAYVHRDDKETVLVLHEFEGATERVIQRGLDTGRFESRGFYGCYSNIAWDPGSARVFASWGGKLHSVDIATGAASEIPFTAKVTRQIDETLRVRTEVPRDTAFTRSHRWSQPAFGDAILYEALGDLWLLDMGRRSLLVGTAALETSPVYDAATKTFYYASWTDDDLGAIWKMVGPEPEKITTVPSQYGSLAISSDGLVLAYIRGDRGIRTGKHLERQTDFELCTTSASAKEQLVTTITWTSNRYGKRPPTVRFAPDGEWLYFTEYVEDALTLKRIRTSGYGEQTLVTFPHATRAVVSPDFRWIAFREYHRTFVTPWEFIGKPLTVSAADETGFTVRVDPEEDGDFTEWSADSQSLYWTRGRYHCTKTLAKVLAGERGSVKIDLAFEYDIAAPKDATLLRGARVLTMNAAGDVLEHADILVEGDRITAVGETIEPPEGTRVLDLEGATIMPGMFDAHGHYGSPISALNVIEQRLYGLHANLAYGVTTMFDVYGTTQKDFWVSDMLRAGRMIGPRIYSVGDPVFVTKYRTKMHRPITSLADARELAHFNQDHGATALKDYSNHTRAARQQLVAACRELGLNLVSESFGNPPMNLTQVIDGFTGLEHTMGLTPLYDDVLALYAATEIGVTPTLIVVYNGQAGEKYFHMRERLWENPKLLRFFRKDELIRHRRPTHLFDDDYYHMEMARELHRMQERGVQLQMGAHGQMMGLGAHWEMELLVHGGFTPLEAIRVATINGFRHHGLDHALGSIEAGKLADLVVLDANPMDEITNTRAIRYVMKNGAVYSGADAAEVYPVPAEARKMYFKRGE